MNSVQPVRTQSLEKTLLLLGVSFMVLCYESTVFSEQTIHRLTAEDGLFENAGALFFFMCGVIFLFGYFRDKKQTSFLFLPVERNYTFLMLGLLFLFVSGEEISWGQRILELNPGTFFNQKNIQHETNIHNLSLFNSVDRHNIKRAWWDVLSMSRLFRLFWFTWCLLIPLMIRVRPDSTPLFRRAGVPAVPLQFGIIMAANYLIFKFLEFRLGTFSEVVEIEECVAGFILMLIAIHLVKPRQNEMQWATGKHASTTAP